MEGEDGGRGPGVVDLVGAGPGDPGLVTRKGAELLSQAEVVIYDHLANPRLLDLAPSRALKIYAGKQIGRCALAQSEINDLLVAHARAGRRVVRLKGGDPFVFGRGAEEVEHLRQHGVEVRVVPGVTAGVGVTAYAGIPITHRDSASAAAFVTGHDDPESPDRRLDWAALARFPGTLVIYMGVAKLPAVCRTLIREGLAPSTPAALIQSGTTARQRTLAASLDDLPARVAEANMGPPALLVVGEVVRRHTGLNWYEERPLFGQRILVTRPTDDLDRSAADLEALGAEVIAAPTVQILPVEDARPLDDTIERLAEFDWLVFTSSNGVKAFFRRLIEVRGLDLRAVGHLKLAAIGPSTAEALASFHLNADLVPASYRSEALAEALASRVAGQKVLLARADRGRDVLREVLGPIAHVEQVAVYRNADAQELPSMARDRLASGAVDWLTLTSTAITERLHTLLPSDALPRIGRQIRLASISPVTTEAATRLGWTVAVEAEEYTWAGLVRAIRTRVEAERRAQGQG